MPFSCSPWLPRVALHKRKLAPFLVGIRQVEVLESLDEGSGEASFRVVECRFRAVKYGGDMTDHPLPPHVMDRLSDDIPVVKGSVGGLHRLFAGVGIGVALTEETPTGVEAIDGKFSMEKGFGLGLEFDLFSGLFV